MTEGMRVETSDLKLLASDMDVQRWPSPDVEAAPPDALQLAKDAVASLHENPKVLQQYQDLARAESQRISEMLTSAAKAYDAVDDRDKGRLEVPGHHADIEPITLPAPSPPMLPIRDGPAMTAFDAGG